MADGAGSEFWPLPPALSCLSSSVWLSGHFLATGLQPPQQAGGLEPTCVEVSGGSSARPVTAAHRSAAVAVAAAWQRHFILIPPLQLRSAPARSGSDDVASGIMRISPNGSRREASGQRRKYAHYSPVLENSSAIRLVHAVDHDKLGELWRDAESFGHI